jgi:hypothetical protein
VIRRVLLSAFVLAACEPPPAVRAVDAWLTAYAAGDRETMLANTYSGDRELLSAALVELEQVPTGTLATALPPRPLRHELIEIETKDHEHGRWIVLVKTTMKNPLPFMSKRVGSAIEDMPQTRDQRRRFLVIDEAGKWGVKLDLPQVVARARYVLELSRLIERGDFAEAERRLNEVPPPPDEANALKQSDRVQESLRAQLEKARKARR